MTRKQYFDLYCFIAMGTIVGVLGWWVWDTLANY